MGKDILEKPETVAVAESVGVESAPETTPVENINPDKNVDISTVKKSSDTETDILRRLESIEENSLLGVKEILTLREAAKLAGVTCGRMYYFTHKKVIPFYKPAGGRVYFKRKEIEGWLTHIRYNSVDEAEKEAIYRTVLTRQKRRNGR